jgi:hypothetical protein
LLYWYKRTDAYPCITGTNVQILTDTDAASARLLVLSALDTLLAAVETLGAPPASKAASKAKPRADTKEAQHVLDDVGGCVYMLYVFLLAPLTTESRTRVSVEQVCGRACSELTSPAL